MKPMNDYDKISNHICPHCGGHLEVTGEAFDRWCPHCHILFRFQDDLGPGSYKEYRKNPKLKLTKKDVAHYLKHSCHCPFCKSSDISGDSIEVDGDCTWQEITCGDCGAEWRDVYKLSDMEVISGPTVEKQSGSREKSTQRS